MPPSASQYRSLPFYYLRHRRDEYKVVTHLVVPVLAALLLVVVLAQFFSAAKLENYPGLQPQYLGVIIAGGWLVLGIIRLFMLRARNPEALAAGERIYAEQA